MKPCLRINKAAEQSTSSSPYGKVVNVVESSFPKNISWENQRFETSIELQLLVNCQPILRNPQSENSMKQNHISATCEAKVGNDKNPDFQIPLSESKISIAESTYKIQTNDEIGPSKENKCRCRCFSGFQQKIRKLKQQIQQTHLDHKIMKQQIKLDIKTCYALMEQTIKKISNYSILLENDGLYEISYFSEDKLCNKKNMKQKKKYLQASMNKNRSIVQYHQQILQKAVKQYNLFKFHFENLNFGFHLNIEKQTEFQQIQSQRSKRNFEEENKGNDQLRMSAKVQKPQKIEIENIKFKIQQLKNKLVMSSSKYY